MYKIFGRKSSSKCGGFVLFSCYSLCFDEKIVKIFWVEKIRQNAAVLYFLAVIHFVLTKKNVKKLGVEKIHQNLPN